MALRRVVLNVGRSISMVGHQAKVGNSNTKLKGFLVAINSGQRNSSYLNNYRTCCSPFLSLNDFCRRYYFLPSPPPVKILHEVPDGAGVFAIANAETNDRVKEFALFAAKAHNESSMKDRGDDHVGFVRVVRAWSSPDCCERYHIMLEGVDGKGELNVYYAEVVDTPFAKMTKLDKWELVDQSFSYPFQEARFSEQLREKRQQEQEQVRIAMQQEMARPLSSNSEHLLREFVMRGLRRARLKAPFAGSRPTIALDSVGQDNDLQEMFVDCAAQ